MIFCTASAGDTFVVSTWRSGLSGPKQFVAEQVGSKVTLTVSGILEMTSMEKEFDYDEPMDTPSGKIAHKERIIPRARIRIESVTMVNTKAVKRDI